MKEDKKSEVGASMLEYALIALLIAVACVTAAALLGQQTSLAFSRIGSGVAKGNGG